MFDNFGFRPFFLKKTSDILDDKCLRFSITHFFHRKHPGVSFGHPVGGLKYLSVLCRFQNCPNFYQKPPTTLDSSSRDECNTYIMFSTYVVYSLVGWKFPNRFEKVMGVIHDQLFSASARKLNKNSSSKLFFRI